MKKILLLLAVFFFLGTEYPGSPANAQIIAKFEDYPSSGGFFAALSDPTERAAVIRGLNYWNTLTHGTVDLPVRFCQFNEVSDVLAFSTNDNGHELVVFNHFWPFSAALPTQLVTSTDTVMGTTAIHEMGHNLGLTNYYYAIQYDIFDNFQNGQLYGWSDALWNHGILDSEGNSIEGLWINNANQDSRKGESFTAKLNRGVRYVFTGEHASAVNGDGWMDGSKSPVPLPVEAGYQTSTTQLDPGSSLTHSYTRFGLMNAVDFPGSTRPFLSEVELAVFRDLGLTVDLEGQFGNSVYTDRNTVINRDAYSSTNAYGIGLHVVGDNNTIIQAGNIYANGEAGAGVRIEGVGNTVVIAPGTVVAANGANGNGVLVTHGDEAHLINRGAIRAMGADGVGVYFNSGTWTDGVWTVVGGSARQFDNSGILNAGANDAIRLAGSCNDVTINFMDGSRVIGNIVAEEGSQAQLTFGKLADTSGAATSKANSLAVMSLRGNITGAHNLDLNVLSGNLYYTGTASGIDMTVAAGAGLFGNAIYNVNQLTNHGTLAPTLDAAGALTINGNLISDGNLGLAAYFDYVSPIVVVGEALVGGSKVVKTAGSLYLPEMNYELLQAGGSVNGDMQGGALTGLLNATVMNNGDRVTVTTQFADNLGATTVQQQQTYTLMRQMYQKLAAAADSRCLEMAELYSLDSNAAKEALVEIAGGGQLEGATFVPSNSMVGKAITAGMKGHDKAKGQDGEGVDTARREPTDLVVREASNADRYWLKPGKSWSEIGDGAVTNQSGSLVTGTDCSINENWRRGFFTAYGENNSAGSLSRTENRDYRLGLYAGYRRKRAAGSFYADYGWQGNQSTRDLPVLGLQARSNYRSNTLEIGEEYQYDFTYTHQAITWQISPYVNLRAVRYLQEAYQEEGAGVYNQQVEKRRQTYTAGQSGVEISRSYKEGSFAVTIGLKHIFSGDHSLGCVSYAGNPDRRFILSGSGLDRDTLVCGLSGWQRLNRNWIVNGSIDVEQGADDHGIAAEVSLNYLW